MRRWARRIGLAIAAILLALTLAAFGYDLASSGDEKAAAKLYPGPYLRVDGRQVAYRRWGTSGTPILLLGGAAEPSWVWHATGPLLAARGHRVFAIDLPPFGYTERRGPYTMDGWLDLVEGFADRLGIDRPLVVGHSLGAGVAAAYALRRPAKVRGIVLLDGDGLPAGHGIGWGANLLVEPFYPAGYRLLTGSDWFVGRLIRAAWGPDPDRPGHDVVQEFERPFRVDGTEGALKELARHGGPGVTMEELRAVRVPRSVVWGSRDDVDTIEAGRTTAAALGVKIVEVAGAGHLGMLTHPGAVAAAILRAPTEEAR